LVYPYDDSSATILMLNDVIAPIAVVK
jgi:hypothetical protein